MRNHWKRLAALALVLCMVLTVLPVTALAATTVSSAVKNLLITTAEESGFAPEYNGAVTLVSADAESAAVAARLPYTPGVDGRTVAVLVQAVDASGNALAGHTVRYCLGHEKNGEVTLTYQENGAQHFAMLPVQCALEQGSVLSLTTSATPNGSSYTVRIAAELVMSDDLATLAAANKNDTGILEDFRFTCYLENEVVAELNGVDESDFQLDDPAGVYTLVETKVTDLGISIIYRLSDAALTRWQDYTAEEVRAELQTKVRMSTSQKVAASVLEAAANDDGEVYTNGRVEITYNNGEIPVVKVEKIVVPADLAVLNVNGTTANKPSVSAPSVADPVDTGVSEWLDTVNHNAFMQGDASGSFRPDAYITRAEVCAIFYRLLKDQNVEVTASFTDVAEDAWYAEAVNALASLKIVNGYDGGVFKPANYISRAEFAAICARFAKATNGSARFSDVPASHWAYDEINTAAAYGWITGYSNGTFKPSNNISRAEAATMVNRMLGRLADESAIDAGEGTSFPDVAKSHWAFYQIAEATTDHDYVLNASRTEETWK